MSDDDHLREIDALDARRLERRDELFHKRKCPRCGEKILPVLYGLPVETDLVEDAIYAGCIINGSELLERACPECDRSLI